MTSPWVVFQKDSRDSFSPRNLHWRSKRQDENRQSFPIEGKAQVVARIKDRIIEESDAPSGVREAISIFIGGGWPPDDARWLGPLCYSVLRTGPSNEADLDSVTEHNLKLVAGAWMESGPLGFRERALLIAYARLCGCGGKTGQLAQRVPSITDEATPQHTPMALAECTEIAKEFRKDRAHAKGWNLEAALVSGGWPGDYGTDSEIGGVLMEFARDGAHPVAGVPELVRLMQSLALGAGLDLTEVIEAGSLVAIGSQRSIDPAIPLRVPKPIDRTRPPISDARSLVNWMIGLCPRALTKFFPVFRECLDDKRLAAMAVGVQDAIEHWLMCSNHHWTYFREGGPSLAEACQPYLDELERRCDGVPVDDVPLQLRRAWLWFAWCTFEADPSGLTADRREKILRAVTEDVARLRKLFARADPKPDAPGVHGQGSGHLLEGESRAPWEEFEWERDHLRTCVMLLYQLGGVWRGMKPLLLAMRSMNAPAVAADLRYWNEDGRPNRPEPWSVVPESMIALFHAYVGREQAVDSHLTELRGNLASFCLERLVDRWSKRERDEASKSGRERTNDDMVERSPEWRLCLIRAFTALGLNPEAKGHRTLHAAAQMDPHDDVREAAREAYQRLRRGVTLPEDVSPRRAVMSALWWIRQAHLLELQARLPELEIQLDPDGAQRTRTKELTRTKEVERDNKPAATPHK